MGFSQDTRHDVGYQEINQTNKFDKSQVDVIPEILGDKIIPESPKESYLKSTKFKHLPQLQQEFIRNIDL